MLLSSGAHDSNSRFRKRNSSEVLHLLVPVV